MILIQKIPQRRRVPPEVGESGHDNDGIVNFADLQSFKQRFFGNDPDADLNGDGLVNFADLQIAKGFIFGPSGVTLP